MVKRGAQKAPLFICLKIKNGNCLPFNNVLLLIYDHKYLSSILRLEPLKFAD